MLRARDFALSLIILLFVPAIHCAVDTLIYSGQWYLAYSYSYMITIPILTVVICLIYKPSPFFLSGIALAFSLSFAFCMLFDMLWPRHGNRGLDNFLGSFGAMAGALLSLHYHKITDNSYLKSFFAISFLGTAIGFIFFYEVSCNTVIYCGPLSVMHYTK